MSVAQAYLIVLGVLVVGQIMMTRLYGWRGLAFTTAAEIMVIFSGGILSILLLKPPGGGDPMGVFTVIFIAVPVMLLLVSAMILAAFVKTE